MTLQRRPDKLEVLDNKGVVLIYLERYEESVEAFDAALKISPGFHRARRHKELPLRNLRRYE